MKSGVPAWPSLLLSLWNACCISLLSISKKVAVGLAMCILSLLAVP